MFFCHVTRAPGRRRQNENVGNSSRHLRCQYPSQLLSKKLWTAKAGHHVDLEISRYGMFTLIEGIIAVQIGCPFRQLTQDATHLALHGSLFNLTRDEVMAMVLDANSVSPSTSRRFRESARAVIEGLRRELSTRTIERLADGFVDSCGGEAMRRLNSALNAWAQCWESRIFSDCQVDFKKFLCNPLPFWHLAKLFMILRLARVAGVEEPSFSMHKIRLEDVSGKTYAQNKVVAWLQTLCSRETDVPRDEECQAKVASSAPNRSRLTLLLKPV